MPTYAYACTACDHRFEVQQSFTDTSLTDCPECTGTVRKLFNSVGIVFKGSGFYRTDSRGSSGGAGSGKDGSSTTEASKSSAGKGSSGEATPAASPSGTASGGSGSTTSSSAATGSSSSTSSAA